MVKKRSTLIYILLVIGIVCLLWTILILGVGLFYVFGGIDTQSVEDNSYGAKLMLQACTPMNVILCVIFLGSWWYLRKKEDKLYDLASYLKMYRRTALVKVAQRLGISEASAEKLLLDCISKGLVRGFLDRQTGEFILEESISAMREGARCPKCGAYSSSVALPGEVMHCSFCGALIPSQTTQQPMPPARQPNEFPGASGAWRSQTAPQTAPNNPPPSVPADSRFCTHCGSPAQLIEEEGIWFCAKCQKNFD